MDKQNLDDLLLHARPRSAFEEDRLAADIAIEASHRTTFKRPRLTRRFSVALGVSAAGVALTAAGTLTAYQLQVPPFQGLEHGLERISPGIPADYVGIDGKPFTCDAFLEFRNISASQVHLVQTHIRNKNWSTLGSSVYLEAEESANPRTVDGVSTRFYDLVADRLRAEAEDALPGSVSADPAGNNDSYAGSSIHCQPGTR